MPVTSILDDIHDAQVQLIVREAGDRDGLTELLSEKYDVVIEETLQPVDCYLIDEQMLPVYRDELGERTREAEPVFRPVLVVQREERSIEGQGRLQTENTEEPIIDDVITAPVGREILFRRLDNLLTRRQQSLRLAQRFNRMENRYEQLFESTKDLIAAVDVNLDFLFANTKYCEFHGLDPTAVEGEPLRDILGPRAFDEVEESVFAALEGEESRQEITRETETLGTRVLDAYLFPLRGRAGTIRGVGASMRDITERNRLEEDLRESKERYESLFDSIRDAILVADTDRRIINCNPAFVDLFGYELEEIEGKQTKYVYASEEEYREMGEAIEGHVGDPQFTHQFEYEKKSGQTFPGETNIFYLRNAKDDIVGFIGVVRDVSDRQNRLQQLQRVDRVLQHNFNNDINVIQGFADKIETEATAPINGFAQKVRETGEALLQTVENERKITKFLSDPPPSESLNLRQVCETVIERVSHSHPQASLLIECPENIVIEATPAIELAIEELLINAITHSPETEPQVLLKADLLNAAVAIRVQDTNPRISEMDRKVIAGEEEPSSLYHGSGLGLWLVSLIANHSGGKLEFGKNEPDGNIVSIILPK